MEREGAAAATRFKTGKTGELLAFLACRPGTHHRREELARRLWPDAETAAARANLRTALASLRRQLEPGPRGEVLLLVSPSDVALNRAAAETDVAQYESAWRAATAAGGGNAASDIADAAERLERAVALYRGEFLAGYDADWVDEERVRLAALHAEARLLLVRLLERCGRAEAAIPVAQGLVREDPTLEEAHAALMRAYAAIGRPQSALRQYRTLRRALKREGGATAPPPSEEVTRLARSLRSGASVPVAGVTAPAAAAPAAPAASAAATRGAMPREYRFPIPTGALFGREEDAERVLGLLRGSYRTRTGGERLVTLTGVGGVGKTRLALELARRAAAEHGGVYFVPLAGVAAGEGAADLVLASVLQALREPVAQIEPLRDQVVRALESRQAVGGPLLLVLDNFEHLLPGGAAPGAGAATPGDPTETVAFLLECAPHLRCLVTSRRPLGLLGERVVPLAPLAVPFPGWEWERVRDSPSVRLFVERARVRQVDFAVTPRNAAPLAEICAAVEGLPLAIELAAARAYLVPVSEMLAHLQTRFEFLIEPTRGRPVRDARHSALRNTIAWSYRLLAPPLRELFARLSVFRGFDSATAAAVLEADATEAARGIEELRACSLVEAAPGAEGRFRMLDAVREFAAGELAASEAAALRQRHAEHFLGVARRAIEAARGPEQGLWLDRLEAEVDNVRAALAASLETETGLRLTSALHHYWYVRGHLGEGRRWMRRALEACPDPPDQVLSSTLNALGVFAWTQGDFGEAEQCFGEALAVRERTGDRIGVAGLQNNMGSLAQQRGDLGTARARLDASIALYRELNRSHQLAHALYNRASVAVDGGESEHALALLTESLELAEAGGDRYALANGHQLRAVVALLGGGDTGAAARDLAAALEARRELKDRRSLPGTLVWAAALSARRGDPMRAARLLGAASELRARLSALLSPSEERAFAGEVAAAQAALSPDAFAVAWEEGTAFSPDQAVLYVLAGLPLAGGGTEKIY